MTNSPKNDHYQILNLPFTGTPNTGFTKQQLKLAYHKALLQNHPDKAAALATDTSTTTTTTTTSSQPTTPREQPEKLHTIDEITTAYKTLSDPRLRAEYDRALRLDRSKVAEREKNATVFHTGLEVVDLEDLSCEEGDYTRGTTNGEDAAGGDVWYRGCRCGDERGFILTEEDLEREAEHGEIVVGCRGCSLWMKVLFAVADEEEEGLT